MYIGIDICIRKKKNRLVCGWFVLIVNIDMIS